MFGQLYMFNQTKLYIVQFAFEAAYFHIQELRTGTFDIRQKTRSYEQLQLEERFHISCLNTVENKQHGISLYPVNNDIRKLY